MDFWYGLLKVASMVATGLFGALGLLTKYKDNEGRITKWGKIALAGIILTSLLSLTLYTLETSRANMAAVKAKAAAEATTKRLEDILVTARTTVDQQKISLAETNRLKEGLSQTLSQQDVVLQKTDEIAKGMEISLAEQQAVLGGNEKILGGVTRTIEKQSEVLSGLDRSINVIKDVTVTWELELPLDDPALFWLKESVEEIVAEFKDKPNYRTQCGDTIHNRGLSTILLERDCVPLGGTPLKEILRGQSLLIAFSRKPEITLPGADIYALPDLHFSTKINYNPDDKQQERAHPVFQLEYDPQRRTLLILGIQMAASQLRANGEIVSLPDLKNSYLRVSSIYDIANNPLTEEQLETLRLLSLLKLRTLAITINGQTLIFNEKVFGRGLDAKRRLPYFYTNLPDSLEQFRNASR
jgi:hypothetical protein